jgi:hypothetical protein
MVHLLETKDSESSSAMFHVGYCLFLNFFNTCPVSLKFLYAWGQGYVTSLSHLFMSYFCGFYELLVLILLFFG